MSCFVAFVPFCSRLGCSAILEQKGTKETKKNLINVYSVVSRSIVAAPPLARNALFKFALIYPKFKLWQNTRLPRDVFTMTPREVRTG